MSTAKRSTADALWKAVNAAARTFGGYVLDAEYDAEKEFRKTQLHRVSPISTSPISSCLAEHGIGLPRSV